MRRTLIAGNWKMNGSLSANQQLIAQIAAGLTAQSEQNCDVLICAPSVYLMQCAQDVRGSAIQLGAQDVSVHTSGAYTGEISAEMLLDVACRYVIVGHSERRAYHHESNEIVAQKASRAVQSGLLPIVCVGETLEQREMGQTSEVVLQQLRAVLAVLDDAMLPHLVLAYEPVWAIGTGRTATPQMAQDVHAVLRAELALRSPEIAQGTQILYGGSMKPDNARELLAMPDIDGGLIGGAALKASDFLAIIAAA